MGVYVLTFVLVIYEAVSTAVNQFLTPEGKQQAAEFFKEAMTNNLHHF
jgi:lipopolysaccharide export LptBFGC system permease protein LptF